MFNRVSGIYNTAKYMFDLMQSSYNIISLILSPTLNAYIEHILISFVHIYVIVSVLSDGYIK